MMTLEKISPSEKLVATFIELQNNLPGGTSVKTARQKAIESFSALGIPNRKHEEYKYSNPQPLFQKEFHILTAGKSEVKNISIDPFLIPGLKANIVVLINGFFSNELSSFKDLPKGVVLSSLGKAFQEQGTAIEKHFAKHAAIGTDTFLDMNTAFAADGVFISVPDNTIVEKPIHIINIVTAKEPSLSFPRNLFIVGKNSALQVVESTDTLALDVRAITVSLDEIFVDEGAKLQYYKLQNDCKNSYQVNGTYVRQEKNSHFDTNTVTLSGEWIRNNLSISPEGENCETHLNGLFITEADQHVDNHTLVDHRKPHCQSNQLYKGILAGKSVGVFNGKIFVQPDAQKTNAYQSSKNILLTDDASINTKPQLEIYADDVKCSHGSTTGQLNEEAIFYLRSRGLSTDSARSLLLFAFANDVLNTIRIEALKDHLEGLVRKRLEN